MACRSLTLTLALVAASFIAHAQQLSRETEFEYHPVTGQVTLERVDPGGSHCTETAYEHDIYGNRQRVVVRPCSSTVASARFTPRVTVNHFEAGSGHSAGAYLTKSQFGTEASPNSGIRVMTESRTEYDAGHGAAARVTAVALGVADGSRNLSSRTIYDALGRVQHEYAPVSRNTDGSLAELKTSRTLVYCKGSLVPDETSRPSACLRILSQVPVTYASQRLVDSEGRVLNTAQVSLETAYFVETQSYTSGDVAIGQRARVHFDSLHREIAKEVQNHDGQWTRTLTGYDTLGQVAAQWGAHFSSGNSSVTAAMDEVRQWTTQRDLLHRPTHTAQMWRGSQNAAAEVITSTVSYNGTSITSTDPKQRTRTAVKNGAGQVAQTIDPYGATVIRAFDAFGNLLESEDALGNVSTAAYTPVTARFRLSAADPNKGTWQYTHDALGQLLSQTDARLITTSLQYDAMGRLIQRSSPGHTSFWRFSLGDAGATQSAACADGLPRLCKAWTGQESSPVTVRVLIYDKMGRVEQSDEVKDRSYRFKYRYDALGRLETLHYPTGLKVFHTYSEGGSGKLRGTLTKLSQAVQTGPNTFAASATEFWSLEGLVGPTLDARGALLQQKLGNGVVAERIADPISGKAFVLRAGKNGGRVDVLDQRYSFDQADNLVTRTNGFVGGHEAFAYDELDRLRHYTLNSPDDGADRTVSVGYNALGNIISKSDVGGYEYQSSRPNAVSRAGGTQYVYDANGNLLETSGSQKRVHTWTDFNLPHTAGYGSASAEFWYDDQHKRVQEVIKANGTERRLWMLHPDASGGLGYEREEVWTAGALSRVEHRHYLSVGGSAIGVVKTTGDNNPDTAPATVPADAASVNYWHRDSLGSIVAVSNGVGDVLERAAFDAWGRRLLDSGRADLRASGPSHGDRGYTGHEHLDELALVHMNARLYDPLLARFLSPDPVLQDPDNLQNHNAYSYVLNNPLRFTDPSGEFIDPLSAKIFATFFSAIMATEGNKYWRMVGQIALAFNLGGQGGLLDLGLGAQIPGLAAGAMGNSMAAGFVTGLISSGGDLEQAVFSGLFAGAFQWAGGQGEPLSLQRLVLHAVIGCAQGAASGGKCGPSAAAALVGKAGTGLAADFSPPAQYLIAVIAGGTASVVGGGKFANGAVQASFGYLFNACGNGKCFDFGAKNVEQYYRDGSGKELVVKMDEIEDLLQDAGTTWTPTRNPNRFVLSTFGRDGVGELSRGRVLGDITVERMKDGSFRVLPDYYNFEQHDNPNNNLRTGVRNAITARAGESVGPGVSFFIRFEGTFRPTNPLVRKLTEPR